MTRDRAASWQDSYLDRWYRSRPGWVDGTTEYWGFLSDHLPRSAKVLELGCGPTNRTSRFLKETFGTVDGLDVDEEAKDNEWLDDVYIYDGNAWPTTDESHDAIVSDYVLEHVESPSVTIREVTRTLRPGGVFVFRTPNRWHYVAMVSYLTPHWFHRFVANRLRRQALDAHDPWPTFYRMNSRRTVRRLCRQAGLRELELRMIEKEPSYGMSCRLLFVLFALYGRLVNSARLFAGARANMLCAFQKPPRPETTPGQAASIVSDTGGNSPSRISSP